MLDLLVVGLREVVVVRNADILSCLPDVVRAEALPGRKEACMLAA